MKNIIIYTTNDKIVSLHLVNKIVSLKKFKNCNIDILISKPNFIRKIKILIVIFFFGSLKDLIKNIKNSISINQILSQNKNCKIIKSVNKEYDIGLSVYNIVKIKLQKFKIYNFHLGSLKYQRGSFIFFYKFIKNWKKITLSFHEITEKFDVGEIINEKEIILEKDCKATDIIFAYLSNLDFLEESLNKISNTNNKQYNDYEKLLLVPSFMGLFKYIFKFFFKVKR